MYTMNQTRNIQDAVCSVVYCCQSLTLPCMFTYPHKELQYYQLHYVKHVSLAAV